MQPSEERRSGWLVGSSAGIPPDLPMGIVAFWGRLIETEHDEHDSPLTQSVFRNFPVHTLDSDDNYTIIQMLRVRR